jgi:hypothetical protein
MKDFISQIAHRDLTKSSPNSKIVEDFFEKGTDQKFMIISYDVSSFSKFSSIPKSMGVLIIDYTFKDEKLYYAPFLLAYRLIRSMEEETEESFKDIELLKNNVIIFNLDYSTEAEQLYLKGTQGDSSNAAVVRISLRQSEGQKSEIRLRHGVRNDLKKTEKFFEDFKEIFLPLDKEMKDSVVRVVQDP